MPAALPFVSWVEQKDILEALRVEPFDSKVQNACIRIQNRERTLADVGTFGRQDELLREAGVTDLETLNQRLVSTYLRSWVVEWMRSGGNQPQRRDLNKAPGVLKVLRDYSPRMPCRPHVFPKGPVRFAIKVGYPEEPDSRVDLWRLLYESPVSKAKDEAARLLFGLMIMSDWAYRLCRCPHCGVFFFVEKKLRNVPYVHGPFCCVEHQRHASAITSTNRIRAGMTDGLVERAARWLLKWRHYSAAWRDDRRLKERLNVDLRGVVRANWVTRHQDAIEQKRLELIAERRGGAGSR